MAPAGSYQQAYAPVVPPQTEPASGRQGVYHGYAVSDTGGHPIPSTETQPPAYASSQQAPVTYTSSLPSTPVYPQQNPAVREAAYSYRVPEGQTLEVAPTPYPATPMPAATYTHPATSPTAYTMPPPSAVPLPQTYPPTNVYTSPVASQATMPPGSPPTTAHESAEFPAFYSPPATPRRKRGPQSFENTHERITLWIDKRLKQAFDELSYEQDLSKSSLLNEAVADLLRKYSSR